MTKAKDKATKFVATNNHLPTVYIWMVWCDIRDAWEIFFCSILYEQTPCNWLTEILILIGYKITV